MGERNRLTLGERALLSLRDAIFSGEFPAGTRLTEVALADRLGLSRTPLREALARLEREGLVERAGAAGYRVRRFTFDDVRDALELRGVLEGTAARLAAERGVDAGALARLGALLDRLDAAIPPGDPDGLCFDDYFALNAEFHAALASLAGNGFVVAALDQVTALPFASPSAFLAVQEQVPAFRRSLIGAQAQHRDIVDAIARRQSARAEALAREHARLALRNFEYVLDRDRSLIARVPGLAPLTPAPDDSHQQVEETQE